ncbi:MAG: T9SS type A sorting domain-containing protein, partial [Candidatus Marinimicrobia bacterium]|nr:T9SS type A sorting domain-containing protein [Candidatus Neomarinimicrobiota bacterium]
VSHVPYYSEVSSDVYEDNQNQIVPLFEEYGVDAVFSGHIHAYERGDANGVYYIITGGGGGVLSTSRKREIPEIDVVNFGYHFDIIEIDGKQLDFTQYNKTGVALDHFEIDKFGEASVETKSCLAIEYSLENSPNPFNASVRIMFSIPKSGNTSLKIYDLSGRERVTIIPEWYHQPGQYATTWSPDGLSSGCYILSLFVDGINQMNKKIVYLK